MDTWILNYYHLECIWLNTWADVIVPRFCAACISGGIFIAGVWLLCRLAPRLPVGTRCWLWWLACLKLLVGLIWMDPVMVPILPASHFGQVSQTSVQSERSPLSGPLMPSAPGRTASSAGSSPHRTGGSDLTAVAAPPGQETNLTELEWQQPSYVAKPYTLPHVASTPSLALILLICWLIGMILCCNRIERRLRRLRVLLRRADREVPDSCSALAVEVAGLLRLRCQPRMMLSAETASPLVTGLFRPTVILPAPDTIELSPSEARMVLAHEMTHIKRGDLWLTWVPLFAQCLFFLFPPLWLAVREWMAAREVACDAAAIRLTGASVQDYGRLLIRIPSTPGPYHSAGALYATGTFVEVKRRIELIKRYCRNAPRFSRPILLAVGLLAVLCLLPWRVAARSHHPHFPFFAADKVKYQVTDLGHAYDSSQIGDSLDHTLSIAGISKAGVVYGQVWKTVEKPLKPNMPGAVAYLWVWEEGRPRVITDVEILYGSHLSVNPQGQITGVDATGRPFLYDRGQLQRLDKKKSPVRKIEDPFLYGNVRVWSGKEAQEEMVWYVDRPNALKKPNALGQRIVAINGTPSPDGHGGLNWGPSRGCLLDKGKVSLLGCLPGDMAGPAIALNNRGVVVGTSITSETRLTVKGYKQASRVHAVLWQDGRIADLGALPGKSYMYPLTLNDAGQVIGTAHSFENPMLLDDPEYEARQPFISKGIAGSSKSDGDYEVQEIEEINKTIRPFLYTDGEMYDLNDLTPANSGWRLDRPLGINNAGQIVGYGAYQGREHWFLLTPLPRSPQ